MQDSCLASKGIQISQKWNQRDGSLISAKASPSPAVKAAVLQMTATMQSCKHRYFLKKLSVFSQHNMDKILQNPFNDGREILVDAFHFVLSNIYYSLRLDTAQCTKYVGNDSYHTLKIRAMRMTN